MQNYEDYLLLKRAFPLQVAADLAHVASALGRSSYPPNTGDIGLVILGGETLHIPTRVYFCRPDEQRVSELSYQERLVLSCIYSRHHSGYTREAHLRTIIRADSPWIAPYVIQLIGEYVVEILHVIAENVDVLRRDMYRAFVAENPAFLSLTRARAISYWNEYYRRETPNFEHYVGHRLLRALDAI